MKPLHRYLAFAALLALPLVFFATCGNPPQPGPTRADELLNLPYLGYVTQKDEEDAGAGVVFHDPALSQPGYRLYTIHPLCAAEIVDGAGRRVKFWQHQPGEHWSNCILLPNGDLLAVGAEPMPGDGGHDTGFLDELRYVIRMDWEGRVLWKRHLPAHHDIQPGPDGTFLTLTFRRRLIPAIDPKIETRDDQITVLDADGNILKVISLYDALAARPDRFTFKQVWPNLFGGTELLDLFHSNSIVWIRNESLAHKHPIYASPNVLVSSRNQDGVFAVNLETGTLEWFWGRGVVEAQHDAHPLENGNLLVFDNGAARAWSRAVEYDPASDKVVWEYKSSPPESFHTLSRGSAQRLANGNTLIADSDHGRAFEVTRSGRLVWEFVCPYRSDDGQRASIVRMKELDTTLVESLLATSGGG